MEIYDIMGKKIRSIGMKEDVSNYRLDLSGCPKGIYFLNVTSGNERYSKKIILE
jgi:hypothetical protein